MTRKRHTEEQIIAVLKDAQAGEGPGSLSEGTASRMPLSKSGGRNMPVWKSAM